MRFTTEIDKRRKGDCKMPRISEKEKRKRAKREKRKKLREAKREMRETRLYKDLSKSEDEKILLLMNLLDCYEELEKRIEKQADIIARTLIGGPSGLGGYSSSLSAQA